MASVLRRGRGRRSHLMERPLKESAEIAKRIAAEVVGLDTPPGTWVRPTQTSDGEAAIRLVILLPEPRSGSVTGEQLIAIMGKIRGALADLGETRLPLISFARIGDEAELERAQSSASA